jgi:hypothetical protein
MIYTRQCEKDTRKWSEKGVWKNIMDSLVSHGYNKGLIDVNDLSIDSSTLPAKKGRSRRLATTVMTGRRKESRYMQ